jgi:hypothetical protein
MANSTPSVSSAGGRAVITAGGQRWSARTAVKITPTNYERTAGSNQDGTVYYTTKPMPAEAEFGISDFQGLTIETLMATPLDVTIVLPDVKRTYFFTAAVVVGRPNFNTESGEISGLKITSGNVTYTNN